MSPLDQTSLTFLRALRVPLCGMIVLVGAASPACQKTNVGCRSRICAIVAVNFNTVCGVFGSSVSTVIVFICVPVRSPILNVAVISPFSPGATAFDARAAVVQPHDGFTALMWTGASPLFSYLKTASTFDAPSSGCRSSSVFSKTSAAGAEATRKRQRAPENKNRWPFMEESKGKRRRLSMVERRALNAAADQFSWDICQRAT